MTRILRAFLWMRWRILVNSLERTSARDRLERFSVATDKLGPILALVLLIPSSIGLLVLGLIAGFGVGTGSWMIAMDILRYFLLLALALTVVGPLILPGGDMGAVVRLVLLPIPRFLLYVGQMVGNLGDPWIVLTVPLLVGVAIGLAVGLKFVAALIALAAAIIFVAFLMGLASFVSAMVHLVLRDRRRGEIAMLVFIIIIIPFVAMLPQFLIRPTGQGDRRLTRAEREALPPSRTARIATAVAPYVPSELYRRSTLNAVTAPASSALPLAGLALFMLAVQAAGFSIYQRVVDMPLTLGARRAGAFGGLWNKRIPGLSPAASAVAFTQLRLALRTPRGRASIISPLLMPILLAAVTSRVGRSPLPGLATHNGLGIAIFGVFTSILALMPLALNQFAIDKAGFTRQMLSPVSVRELLFGKAVGNAMVAAIPGLFCLAIPAVMFSLGRAGYWPAIVFGAIACYALFAPAAATLSALFPKTVDLNSIGSSSQAHQAAGLLGMLTIALSVGPSVLLVFVAKWLDRPELVAPLVGAWCLVALGLSYVLFIPVARFVETRRESLAQHY